MVASSGQTSRSGSHGVVALAAEQQADERARVEEPDPRAHAVAAARAGAEPVAQPLGQPALHALGRHHHDLLGERVVEGHRQQLAEGVGELVGARCAVQVERHGRTLRGGGDSWRGCRVSFIGRPMKLTLGR